MEIKSIPTRYNNRFFRSRLEARWAVFFDELGVEYDYELDGKIIGGVTYLCDFWIPHIKCWVEIKPGRSTETELSKARSLCMASRFKVYVFEDSMRVSHSAHGDVPQAVCMWPLMPDACGEDEGYSWCECPECGEFGIEFQGRADRLGCKGATCLRSGDRGHNTRSTALVRAYRAAMEKRFEFE